MPDFESRWIDATIELKLKKAQKVEYDNAGQSGRDNHFEEDSDVEVEMQSPSLNWVTRDPTYRISKLAAANSGVVKIAPDATLAYAVTKMLAKDFSQLPVMTTDREVKGMISWKSIGSRLVMGSGAGPARLFMEEAFEVSQNTSIFDAISIIVKVGYVLVRGEHNLITGIVTASDLSVQFQSLTEPFLLLSEIENLLRNLIGDRFSINQLAEAQDPSATARQIDDVSDLAFGEYIRLLENPSRWSQLGVVIDRDLFCKNLDKIREIRNDVMHFDPDGISAEELAELRDFAQFLKSIENLRV